MELTLTIQFSQEQLTFLSKSMDDAAEKAVRKHLKRTESKVSQ